MYTIIGTKFQINPLTVTKKPPLAKSQNALGYSPRAKFSIRPRQKLLNHIAVRMRQSQTHKPTNPQVQEIRVRSSMWVCGFLLNDVGFCVYQFLNPHRNSQTHVINPQDPRNPQTHAI